MKKFLNSAFTMAEAILVMTILGIIATIMISTLKPAEFKEKGMQVMAKKVLSEIDVATTQILLHNSADGTFDKLYEAGTSNVFNSSSADASNKLVKLYKNYLTTLRTVPEDDGYGTVRIMLKDGAVLGVGFVSNYSYGSQTCDTIFPGETTPVTVICTHGVLIFDINYKEPPNVWGKDLFMLPLGRTGIEYDAPEDTE